MKQIISTENKPIKLWLDDIEDGALEQAKNLANLPFLFKHVAIMPDAHQGYGMPIGGVIATENVVIPNAVGVDIGCGMMACKTSLSDINKNNLNRIIEKIRKVIPLGFNKHEKPQEYYHMPCNNDFDYFPDNRCIIVKQHYENALKQIGTLGSNNHFIEIQKGSDNHIWVMIHSGSRNLGKQVADYYNGLAITLNKEWFSCVPKEYQLAFLPLETEQGLNYMEEMIYCVKYAHMNRYLMMERIKECFDDVMFDGSINIAHNYAKIENHFGRNVVVHRKGATSAYDEQIGIIPGSQGSSSFIVEGLGNPESFMSCSHGASRLMSRTKARNDLDLNAEIKKLDDLGVVHSIRNKTDLDEATGAYKDINTVMNNQLDLVKIKIELKPLAVIKG